MSTQPTPQPSIVELALEHFELTDAVRGEIGNNLARYTEHTGGDEVLGLFRAVRISIASVLYDLDETHRSFEGVFAWVKEFKNDKGWAYYRFEEDEDYEMYLASRPAFLDQLTWEQQHLLKFFERNCIQEVLYGKIGAK